MFFTIKRRHCLHSSKEENKFDLGLLTIEKGLSHLLIESVGPIYILLTIVIAFRWAASTVGAAR